MNKIKVSLINQITAESLSIVTDAARLCFVKDYEPSKIFQPKLFTKLIEMKHMAPLEFLDFTFHLQGISRVASLQLVRHRTCSWMSSSFQYQSAEGFDYVVPPNMSYNNAKLYHEQMASARKTYIELKKEIGQDNARYCIPTSARTDMFMKVNLRNLIHLVNVRICKRNSPEIVHIAKLICQCLPYELLEFFAPDCMLGGCTQGKMQCSEPYMCVEEML